MGSNNEQSLLDQFRELQKLIMKPESMNVNLANISLVMKKKLTDYINKIKKKTEDFSDTLLMASGT